MTELLQQRHMINAADSVIYEFGFERLFTYMLNIITTFVIGCLIGLPFESLIFSVAFILMRHNNGGAHASSDLMCYIISTLSILACLYGVKTVVPLHPAPLLIFAAMAPFVIVVLMLSPVEDSNKPLDDVEKPVYRQRGIVTTAICTAFALCLMMLNLLSFGCAVVGAIILTSISMIVGSVKNRIQDNKIKP